MMGGRRPASGAGSYFNASSNPRVAATGQILDADRGADRDLKEDIGLPVNYNIGMVIVDIMLAGVNLVEDFKGTTFGTSTGYEAGWVVIRRLLRDIESPYRDIPVLIVSARSLDLNVSTLLDDIWRSSFAPINYVEKYVPSWVEDVVEIINNNIRKWRWVLS